MGWYIQYTIMLVTHCSLKQFGWDGISTPLCTIYTHNVRLGSLDSLVTPFWSAPQPSTPNVVQYTSITWHCNEPSHHTHRHSHTTHTPPSLGKHSQQLIHTMNFISCLTHSPIASTYSRSLQSPHTSHNNPHKSACTFHVTNTCSRGVPHTIPSGSGIPVTIHHNQNNKSNNNHIHNFSPHVYKHSSTMITRQPMDPPSPRNIQNLKAR